MKINIGDTLKEILALETNELDESDIKNLYYLTLDFNEYDINNEVLEEFDKILEINNDINVTFENCTLKNKELNVKNVKNLELKNCDVCNLDVIKGIKKIKKLEIYDSSININDISNLENLEILSIENNNLEYLSNTLIDKISSIKNLKELSLNNIEDANLENLKNIENLEKLSLSFENKNYEQHLDFFNNMKEFNNLKSLSLTRIDLSNFSFEMPSKIEDVCLGMCNISKINFDFSKYEKLKYLDLNNNNLSEDVLPQLYNLKTKGIKTSVFCNPLESYLEEQKILFNSPQLEQKLKMYMWIGKNRKMTQYEIFSEDLKYFDFDITEILELQEKGIYEKIKNDSIDKKITINQHETLTQAEIEYIINNDIKNLEINDPTAITDELLDVIKAKKGIKITIKDDLKEEYNVSELKLVTDKMIEIKNILNEKETDAEKIFEAYKILGKNIEYDNSGCIDKEEYIEGRERITRSLYGCLVEKKGVCTGYSLTLKKILNSVGIQCIEICGYAYNDPKLGHAWNQVWLDGISYNCDVTWDNKKLKEGDYNLEWLLRSDEDFKAHTTYKPEIVQKCDFSYDISKLTIEKNKIENLEEQVQDGVSMEQINEENIVEDKSKESCDDNILV